MKLRNTDLSDRFRVTPLLAGALGGLIGTWFKFGWDLFWPPRPSGRLPQPEVLITMFTHQPSSLNQSHIISFTFSVVFGMIYAALAERLTVIVIGDGLLFGFVIWLGAHEIVMPLMGLTPPTWALSMNEQFAELFGHVLWGLVIGAFYRAYRDGWRDGQEATAATNVGRVHPSLRHFR